MSLLGQPVTVLGAGIAGLAVARALAMRGAGVSVLERAQKLEEVGAGIQIGPNGMAVLRALGLEAEAVAVGMRSQAVHLCNGADGALITRMNLAGLPEGQDYRFFHRADLVALLARAAAEAGASLRFDARVEAVDLTGRLPRLAGQRDATEVPLLIGADGLHSVVRQALTGRVAPYFTHQVAWRATIPGDGGAAVAEVHMGPGRHLVSYPLRDGALRNIVAVEERRAWVAEGWHMQDDPDRLRAAFAGFSPRVRGWLQAAQDVHLWGLFRHPVAPHWFRQTPSGAAAVLGDAAHPMLPFLAQGAGMALEDAWVLAAALAGHDSPGAGLAAFQAARAPRCARAAKAAGANARLYHMSGLARLAGHTGMRVIGRLAPDWPRRRFDWLYGTDVTR